MATVMNWALYENLATNRDFFDKLRDFAVSCGWTKSREERSKRWAYSGGYYQFIAGSEEFMELKSTGFGSQNLIYRFRLRADGSADAEGMDIGGHLYDTLNTGSSDHPVNRNGTGTNWNGSYSNIFPTKMASIPAVWFFGNSKVIFWVMKFDSMFCICGFFGTPELFSSSETQYYWLSFFTGTITSWVNKSTFICPFDYYAACIYFQNAHHVSDNLWKANFTFSNANTYYDNIFAGYGNVMNKNSFSEVRPTFQQIFYVSESSIWKAIGTPWVVRVNTHGLLIGEHLKFGEEEYISFPYTEIDTKYCGYAFRI